jgi:peptidoglycan/xylan/chitin deacetylase (PgdA/CDA1 family)
VKGGATRRLRVKRALAAVVPSSLRSGPHGFRCLVYHSVTPADEHDIDQMTTPISLLRAQLDYVRSTGRPVVRLGSAVRGLNDGTLADGAVALTFDDGFRDGLTNVLPVLQDYGVPATFFVTTGIVRRERAAMHNAWPGTYLDVEELRRLAASPLVEIGLHSRTHTRLRGLDYGRLMSEVGEARHELATIIGTDVELFAYPFGSFDAFDARTVAALRSNGFQAAVTGVIGVNKRDSDPFRLARCRVSWAETVPLFARLLDGAYDWYRLPQMLQALAGGFRPPSARGGQR